jgi:trimethylamine monooxygenase
LWPDSLFNGTVWENNHKLFYLGMQDQWYTFNMFDAQAWYVRDVILGRLALPALSEMKADFENWRAREATLEGDEANIRFQADYIKALMELTDYPTFDIESTVKVFLEWEHNKHENIMTFRDCCHRSVLTGTMSPAHHTPWMEALDDSMDCYLRTK